MNFLAKFERAMALGGACFRVLMMDKEMLVFPLLSLLALGVLFAAGIGPLAANGQLEAFRQMLADNPDVTQEPWFLAAMFGVYFVCYFVVIFFNAALVTCAMIRFAGGDPTVMDGLRSSVRNLPNILAWSLFAASIGFILDMIEDRSKGLARFIMGFIGTGWKIATYFAVPVLVVERVGPIEAVSRSIGILRKTWGEALISHFGLSALYLIPFAGGFLCALAGGAQFEARPLFASVLWLMGILFFFLSTLVISTLGSILKAALYVYAVEGTLPSGTFDDRLISDAFKD